MTDNNWDAGLYDAKHSFVWEFGVELVQLLAPQQHEKILDIGCGTGHLAAEVSKSGATVVGVDNDANMIERAKQHYQDLQFELADALNLPYKQEFDAAFSNAVLHWVRPPEDAVDSIRRALKPGGRFVAEFGGKGNIALILDAVNSALDTVRGPIPTSQREGYFFPGRQEYVSLLEARGFSVSLATLVDRPTPLDGGADGMRLWLNMFAKGLLSGLEDVQQNEVFDLVEAKLRPVLYKAGRWTADYKRLRVVAYKEEAAPV